MLSNLMLLDDNLALKLRALHARIILHVRLVISACESLSVAECICHQLTQSLSRSRSRSLSRSLSLSRALSLSLVLVDCSGASAAASRSTITARARRRAAPRGEW